MSERIGIDLDKTIFDCKSVVYNFISKFNLNRNSKLKYSEVKKEGIYKGSLLNKVCRMLNPDFYFTIPDAVEVINKMKEQGYEVHLVSSRPNISPIVYLTVQSLEKHGISYDKLVLGCNNKLAYAQENGLNYFVDDMEAICRCFDGDEKIKSFCVSSKEGGKTQAKAKKEPKKILKENEALKRFSWKEISNFFVEKVENVVKKTEDLIEAPLTLPSGTSAIEKK